MLAVDDRQRGGRAWLRNNDSSGALGWEDRDAEHAGISDLVVLQNHLTLIVDLVLVALLGVLRGRDPDKPPRQTAHLRDVDDILTVVVLQIPAPIDGGPLDFIVAEPIRGGGQRLVVVRVGHPHADVVIGVGLIVVEPPGGDRVGHACVTEYTQPAAVTGV